MSTDATTPEQPRTAAGRALLAEADFHDPSCPRWSDVGNPDAPCSCSLPVCVSAIEQEAASELAEAAGYGLAFMADPEGLAHKRDEWRGLLRNALGPAIEAPARPAVASEGLRAALLDLAGTVDTVVTAYGDKGWAKSAMCRLLRLANRKARAALASDAGSVGAPRLPECPACDDSWAEHIVGMHAERQGEQA